MADTGWHNPGIMADDSSTGNIIWNNPNNAKVSDNVYTPSVGGRYGGISHYLKATGFSTFIVPQGATINGIYVRIERYPNTASGPSDLYVKIVKGGVIKATNKAKAGYWSTTQAYYYYGSSTNKWGESWTPNDINSDAFGVVLSVTLPPAKTAFVDHIQIKVYYTPAPTGTNMKVNIADVFKDITEIKINIGDDWKDVTEIKINIGDVWKTVFSL